MSIGVLLITHDQVGQALLHTATATLGMCPLPVEVLAVKRGDDPELLLDQAKELVASLNIGDGVLVLTDMYGSTPSNIARALQVSTLVEVVAGVNLPMLIRILNYPRLSLMELTAKAVSGGRDGIFDCCLQEKTSSHDS